MPFDSPRSVITYQEESWMSLRFEGARLFYDHWLEATVDRSVPLNLDWDVYEKMEAAGLLLCVTARRDGRLIGYVLYIIFPHLHYRNRVVADSDAFFVHKADRRGWVGINLFREAEKLLVGRGVVEVMARVKMHVVGGSGWKRDLRAIFTWLKYRPVETVLRKRIG